MPAFRITGCLGAIFNLEGRFALQDWLEVSPAAC